MSPNRGIRTLFNDMIIVPVKKTGVGRDPRLNNLRNECLVHRYLFVFENTQWNFSLLIKVVAQEFFLSEETVKEILADNNDLRKKIKKEAPQPAILKQRYPHINWEAPQLSNYI